MLIVIGATIRYKRGKDQNVRDVALKNTPEHIARITIPDTAALNRKGMSNNGPFPMREGKAGTGEK
jgi:hypothetical protein